MSDVGLGSGFGACYTTLIERVEKDGMQAEATQRREAVPGTNALH